MMKDVIEKHTSRGLRRALGKLRSELTITRAHSRATRKARLYTRQIGLKLNFGCGSNYKDGWLNIDLCDNADLQIDLRESIPLRSGSAQMVYSEHFLEHLDYPGDALHFLTECCRLLQPHGIFSAGVPDTAWPLLDYAGVGDGRYLAVCERSRWHPDWCRTPMEHINHHFRQDSQHRFAYDFETLRSALETSGFGAIKQREFDATLDTERRRIGTLYVQAVRP
jgi:predicted SAM-dependent methyltransferase